MKRISSDKRNSGTFRATDPSRSGHLKLMGRDKRWYRELDEQAIEGSEEDRKRDVVKRAELAFFLDAAVLSPDEVGELIDFASCVLARGELPTDELRHRITRLVNRLRPLQPSPRPPIPCPCLACRERCLRRNVKRKASD